MIRLLRAKIILISDSTSELDAIGQC